MLLQGGKSGPGAQQIRTGLDRLRQFRLGLGRVTETQVAESDQVMRVGRLEERRLSSATSAAASAAAGFGGRRLLERKLTKLQRPRWGLPGRLLVRRGFIDRNARAVAGWIRQPSDIPFAGHLHRFRAINQPTPASCFMQCDQTLSGCIAPLLRRRVITPATSQVTWSAPAHT